MGILRRGAILKKLNSSGRGGTPLRGLYAQLFKSCRILPDELGKQSPFVLFAMLRQLTEDDEEEDDRPQMSGHLRMFYGE